MSICSIKRPKFWIWAIRQMVAERYFIGIVDTENISLDNKNIFLAGPEVEDIMKIR